MADTYTETLSIATQANSDPLSWQGERPIHAASEDDLRPYFAAIASISPNIKIAHSDFIAARNRIIELNDKDIITSAKVYWNRHPSFEMGADDYAQNAMIGAMDAATRYDGSIKFISFAKLRILGNVKDAVRADYVVVTAHPDYSGPKLHRAKSRMMPRKVSLGSRLSNTADDIQSTIEDPFSAQNRIKKVEAETREELCQFFMGLRRFHTDTHVRAWLLYLHGVIMQDIGRLLDDLSESRISQLVKEVNSALNQNRLAMMAFAKGHCMILIDRCTYDARSGYWFFNGRFPIGNFVIPIYAAADEAVQDVIDIGSQSRSIKNQFYRLSKDSYEKRKFEPLPNYRASRVNTDYRQFLVVGGKNLIDEWRELKSENGESPEPHDQVILPQQNNGYPMTTNTAFNTEKFIELYPDPDKLRAQIIATMINDPQRPFKEIMAARSMPWTEMFVVNLLKMILPENMAREKARKPDDAQLRAELRTAAMLKMADSGTLKPAPVAEHKLSAQPTPGIMPPKPAEPATANNTAKEDQTVLAWAIDQFRADSDRVQGILTHIFSAASNDDFERFRTENQRNFQSIYTRMMEKLGVHADFKHYSKESFNLNAVKAEIRRVHALATGKNTSFVKTPAEASRTPRPLAEIPAGTADASSYTPATHTPPGALCPTTAAPPPPNVARDTARPYSVPAAATTINPPAAAEPNDNDLGARVQSLETTMQQVAKGLATITEALAALSKSAPGTGLSDVTRIVITFERGTNIR